MNSLPSSLLEASNGILFFIVTLMTFFAFGYLARKYHEIGTISGIYRDAKAAVAIAIFFVGIDTGIGVRWWFRFMHNHGYDAASWRMTGTALVIGGTVMAIWGGICWIKVIVPIRYPPFTWVVLTAAAVAFGVGTSLID